MIGLTSITTYRAARPTEPSDVVCTGQCGLRTPAGAYRVPHMHVGLGRFADMVEGDLIARDGEGNVELLRQYEL